MEGLNHLLTVRARSTFQVNLTFIRPGAHKIIAAEQNDAWHSCHLLQALLVRLQIAARLQKAAILRINEHKISACRSDRLGPIGQRLTKVARRNVANRLDGSGLPDYEIILMGSELCPHQIQHVRC